MPGDVSTQLRPGQQHRCPDSRIGLTHPVATASGLTLGPPTLLNGVVTAVPITAGGSNYKQGGALIATGTGTGFVGYVVMSGGVMTRRVIIESAVELIIAHGDDSLRRRRIRLVVWCRSRIAVASAVSATGLVVVEFIELTAAGQSAMPTAEDWSGGELRLQVSPARFYTDDAASASAAGG